MADEDTAGVAGGAVSGLASGAAQGAATGAAIGGPFAPVTGLLGAILGGALGGIGGGLSTHAAQKNQELARYGSGAPVQCPEGFVFDPSSNSCVPSGSAQRDLSDLVRSLKDKDGKSRLVNMVTEMFKKKPPAAPVTEQAAATPTPGGEPL